MKNNKTIQELRDTRVKTTFKVEVTIDLPYFHNHDYLTMHLSDIMEELSKRVDKNDTNGYFTKTNDELRHYSEVSYEIEEEDEYNIHDNDI